MAVWLATVRRLLQWPQWKLDERGEAELTEHCLAMGESTAEYAEFVLGTTK